MSMIWQRSRRAPQALQRLEHQLSQPLMWKLVWLAPRPKHAALQARNVNKMQLVAGEGNSQAAPGKEGDAFNKVLT